MTEREYVGIHKKVHQSMDRLSEAMGIIRANDIAEELNMDIRTVKNHLTICEIDGFGYFIEDNIFITKAGIRKMARKFKMLVKEFG